MSTPLFDPEDPKLTAYALGELTDPADRAEVEDLLAASPEARAAVQDIRDVTALLTAEYDQERQAATVSGSNEPLPSNVIDLADHQPASRRLWERRLWAVAATLLLTGLLAALFVPVTSRVLVKGNGRTGPALAKPPLEGIHPKPPVTKLFPKEEPAIDAEPVAEVAAASPDESTAGAIADVDESKNGARTVPSKTTAPGADAAATPSTVPMFAYQPPPVSVTRATTTSLSPKAAPAPIATVPPTAVAAAPTTLKPMGGSGMGMGGFGAGSGGGGGGSPQTRLVQPLQSQEMERARFYLRADSAAPEVTQYNTPRVAMKEWDASKAATVAPVGSSMMLGSIPTGMGHFNTAAYDHLNENAFLAAKENPLSTFSIDVDTASYANVRRFIEGGSLPPPDAVRLEELINYFPYDYAPPAPDSGQAFAVHLEAASCPWAPEHRLVRIGIKGKEIATDKRPASNLVFLIDVSGSMEPPERLPLIKRAMSMMVEHLTENDHVAIVTYAGNSGLALPSTSGGHKDAILNALDRLEAGGSTNGASGITLAYQVAREGFIKGGTNRVILATDGDFNVGVTSQGELIRMIQKEAKSGVFLSALGVGTDNYKDSTMQKLADKGNGNYNYIDRLEEARKVLVEQMSGTLLTIAKDVKIQVEFNPAVVGSYRLIGYEKRMLRKEDFNDDRIDAGEIGAGHSVTALYEVVPVGQPTPGAAPAVDALKYGAPSAAPSPEVKPPGSEDADAARRTVASPEMLTLKMRSKAPDAEQSERVQDVPLTDHGTPGDFAQASPDFRFAAAVASFGLVLRDSPNKGNATLDAAVEIAQEAKGNDPKGYRGEFIDLIRRAEALRGAR